MFPARSASLAKALATKVSHRGRLAALVLLLPLAACEDRSQPFAPSEGAPAFAAAAGPALIAYVEGEMRTIFLIAEDGTGNRQLTEFDPGYEHRDPDFAPGNRTLLFTRVHAGTGTSELYTIGTNGRKLKKLTALGGETRQGTYSPNGRRIAFIHEDQLYLMNANGSDPVQVTSTTARLGSPSWSPDGSQIAFDVFNPANGTYHIGIMTVATSGWYTMQCPAACHTPRWSPKPEAGLLVVEMESLAVPGTSSLQYLTVESPLFTPFENAPAGLNQVGGWSPDGTRFVFMSTRFDVGGDLLVQDAQGAIIPLTSGPGAHGQPTWSR